MFSFYEKEMLKKAQVASSQAAFKSTLSDPVNPYHSVYDTQRFQELYADPGFVKHVRST